MTENKLQSLILRELGGRQDVRVFRNHVGAGFTGQSVSAAMIPAMRQHGDHFVVLRNPRRCSFGLAPGSSDIIGILNDGRFLSLEIKNDKGRTSQQQKNWIAMIAKYNGISAVVRTLDEAVQIIENL